MQLKYVLTKLPIVGSMILFAARLKTICRGTFTSFIRRISFLFSAREVTNFTYEITPMSRKYLANIVSHATATPVNDVLEIMDELDNDEALRAHVDRTTRESPLAYISDRRPLYGRRVAWYAVARIAKPKVIVETGVDKGLGACVFAAALLRNAADGHPGKYYGADINPEAGYLFAGDYAEAGTLLLGDSIQTLEGFNKNIELFLHDSWHQRDFERREYEAVESKLSADAILLSDNAHKADFLFEFAQKTGRRFVYTQEWSKDYWHPGTGLGIAYFDQSEGYRSSTP
jgi:predicted O-methyltransferase YrrM